MIEIKPMDRSHYEAIFKLAEIAEPFPECQFYDATCQNLDAQRGFTFWEGDDLAGYTLFSNYLPGNSVFVHMTFHPDHRGKISRRILKHLFRYVFETLYVFRVDAISFVGLTDQAGIFLEKLGFEYEGTKKEAARLPAGNYDIKMYGMKKGLCKWL